MGQLRTSPPPPQGRELHAWVLQSGTELRALRAALHQAVHGHPSAAGQGTDDVLKRMLVVVTELASNAIKHGLPPTEVRLSCTDEDFILDVADHDLSSVGLHHRLAHVHGLPRRVLDVMGLTPLLAPDDPGQLSHPAL